MTDWSGGYGGSRPANAKIPVKIHRNVTLVKTSDPLLVDELLSRPKLSRLLIGRLTPEVLLVRPGKGAEVVDELK
ncbi:MAG: hypothetical protein ACRC1K_02680, partial [Planctomycetia bacterium]